MQPFSFSFAPKKKRFYPLFFTPNPLQKTESTQNALLREERNDDDDDDDDDDNTDNDDDDEAKSDV